MQAKIQKHQAFEAEVAAHSNAIVVLDNTGMEMISQGHYASEVIRKRLGKQQINLLVVSAIHFVFIVISLFWFGSSGNLLPFFLLLIQHYFVYLKTFMWPNYLIFVCYSFNKCHDIQ